MPLNANPELYRRANPWRAIVRHALCETPGLVWVFPAGAVPAATLWRGMRGWVECLRELRIEPGDRLVLRVEHDQLAAYCAWLIRAATVAIDWTLTPFCPQPGGLFRLHLIAAARLALPARVRVEVRHDLHGVRLAQVALGFGADTLAGPIDAGRHLPLAGVPRPSETSAAALCELVRQAGLEPTTTASEIRP